MHIVYSTLQANFTSGELSPLVSARADKEVFYKGLNTAKNVIAIPQGGLRRRAGLDYVDTIPFVTNYEEIRLYGFQYSTNTKYTLVFTPGYIYIYKDTALVSTVATLYTASQISGLKFAQDLATLIIVHPTFQPQKLVRGATDADWTLSNIEFKNLPTFDFNQNYETTIFHLSTNAQEEGVTLTADTAVFTPQHVGGTFSSIPGIAIIVGYTNPTTVTVNVIVPFTRTNRNYPGDIVILTEPAFSNTRGWPRCVLFYQSRLFFAGTTSLPAALFGSVLNDYFNFFVGFGGVTDAVLLLLAGQRINSIENMLDAVSLFVSTSAGIYATSPLNQQLLTASSASISRQTPVGALPDVPWLFVDNKVVYAQIGGRDLIGLKYSIGSSSYQAGSETILSEHLIKTPIDMAKIEHSTIDQGNYVYICNSDGSLIVYQTIDAQNINAFTPQETDGKFRRVTGFDADVYFIVERVIDGQTVFYLEKLNYNTLLDCTFKHDYEEPTTVIGGVGFLNGKEVSVIGDGSYLGKYSVFAGQFNLPSPVTNIEVGLEWAPVIIPMPINIETQTGNNIFYKKNISHIMINVYNSDGVTVNGSPIPTTPMGTYVMGSPPTPYSNVYQINISDGWGALQPIVISQAYPASFTLLSIQQLVNAGQP